MNIAATASTRKLSDERAMRCLWRNLLFLHWPTNADALRAMLPRGLALDTFDGRAYIGLVPFTMREVRPRWLPSSRVVRPLARRLWEDFHETNVRTYVIGPDGEPGVWFFSLDAASAAGAFAGRAWFHLPYFFATMRLQKRENGALEYRCRRLLSPLQSVAMQTRALPIGEAAAAKSGTLPHFLVERYALYVARKVGSETRLWRGRVHHSPYLLQSARIETLRENLIAAAGVTREYSQPLAHYARGVDVDIEPLERLF